MTMDETDIAALRQMAVGLTTYEANLIEDIIADDKRLRADLATVTAGRDDFCHALTPRRWTFGQLTAWRRNSQDHEKAFAALLLETVMPGSQDD